MLGSGEGRVIIGAGQDRGIVAVGQGRGMLGHSPEPLSPCPAPVTTHLARRANCVLRNHNTV